MSRDAGLSREVIDRICRRVAELPDRTSPDHWPEAMLVTADELSAIIADESALSHREAGTWIPVSERLPTHIHSVLVYVIAVKSGHWTPTPTIEIGIYNEKRGEWQANLGGEDDEDVIVTHWQPLPEPPKEAARAFLKDKP